MVQSVTLVAKLNLAYASLNVLTLQDPGYVIQQALAAQACPSTWQLLDKYAGHLRQQLIEAIDHPQHKDKPLTGLKITVDAGNGSGGFFASKVCRQHKHCISARRCLRVC